MEIKSTSRSKTHGRLEANYYRIFLCDGFAVPVPASPGLPSTLRISDKDLQ